MRNLLLRAVPGSDLEELRPHLATCELPQGAEIELPGKPVEYAHFFERGFASILIHVAGKTLEVGIVGREGMLGLPAVLGSKIADYQAVVREDAVVSRVNIEVFRQLMLKRRTLSAITLRFMQAGVAQITHMAFANTHLTISQRLARWLLMAHDRVEADTVRVTHAVLSDALGVQRSGVTLALHELEGEEAIRSLHRSVTITDREKLIARAAGSYGPAERAYKGLLGIDITKR